MDSSVDLPQPEGPAIEMYVPFLISRWISSSAWVSTSSVKKTFFTPSILMSVPFASAIASPLDQYSCPRNSCSITQGFKIVCLIHTAAPPTDRRVWRGGRADRPQRTQQKPSPAARCPRSKTRRLSLHRAWNLPAGLNRRPAANPAKRRSRQAATRRAESFGRLFPCPRQAPCAPRSLWCVALLRTPTVHKFRSRQAMPPAPQRSPQETL